MIIVRFKDSYHPNFATKNGKYNKRMYEHIRDILARFGPMSRTKLEDLCRVPHNPYHGTEKSVAGVEYFRWMLNHDKFVTRGV